MKRVLDMKKIMILCASLLMLLTGVVGCGPKEEELIAQVSGVWTMKLPQAEDEARYLLEGVGLMEEEMVLIDVGSPQYVQVLELDLDGTYRFSYDGDGAQALVAQFYRDAFADLYENRTELDQVYGQHFETITREQFYQLYADMYDKPDFQTLIHDMAAGAYNYQVLKQPWEAGTYRIQDGMIFCLIDGTTQEVSIAYEVKGDVLTLTYVDGMEEYHRQ